MARFGGPRTRPIRAWEKKAKAKVYRAEHYLLNKEHINAKSKAWREKNPEEMKAYMRRQNYLSHYGITMEEAEEIFKSQDGKCAICKCQTVFGGRTGAHIDHDHETKEIRGFLCKECNRGLGAFKDNTMIILNAINYLKKKRFMLVHNSFVKVG